MGENRFSVFISRNTKFHGKLNGIKVVARDISSKEGQLDFFMSVTCKICSPMLCCLSMLMALSVGGFDML